MNRQATPQQSYPPPDARVPAKDRLSGQSLGTPNSSGKAASSTSNQSPASNASSLRKKATLASRLSGLQTSEDRVSAKESLSVQTQRLTQSVALSASSPASRTPQEEDHQHLDINPSSSALIAFTRPSSSNVFESGRLGPCERSPIRTLSEDRVHVSLRLGPLLSDTTEDDSESEERQHLKLQLLDKAAGKKVATSPNRKKRAAHNLGSGTKVKKRRTTKTANSPGKKLLMDAITAGSRANAKKKQAAITSTKPFPSTTRKGKDFHPPPKPLPLHV